MKREILSISGTATTASFPPKPLRGGVVLPYRGIDPLFRPLVSHCLSCLTGTESQSVCRAQLRTVFPLQLAFRTVRAHVFQPPAPPVHSLPIFPCRLPHQPPPPSGMPAPPNSTATARTWWPRARGKAKAAPLSPTHNTPPLLLQEWRVCCLISRARGMLARISPFLRSNPAVRIGKLCTERRRARMDWVKTRPLCAAAAPLGR